MSNSSKTFDIQEEGRKAQFRIAAYGALFPICWAKEVPDGVAHAFVSLECKACTDGLDQERQERLEELRERFGDILRETLTAFAEKSRAFLQGETDYLEWPPRVRHSRRGDA